jgi:hypothetical protein
VNGRVAVDVCEELLGEGALVRGEADELVEPSRQRLQRRPVEVLLGGVADRLHFVEINGFEQVLTGWEVAIEGADAHPGPASDVGLPRASVRPRPSG